MAARSGCAVSPDRVALLAAILATELVCLILTKGWPRYLIGILFVLITYVTVWDVAALGITH